MPVRFVLVHPKEPGNIGSSARAMSNFGFTDLRLISPQRPLNETAYKFASHASSVLNQAQQHPTLQEAIGDCTAVIGTTARTRRDSHIVLNAREAAEMHAPRAAHEEIAIIFGPEDWGLSNEHLDLCTACVHIPTADYASLNLAHAVNVLAYEWFYALSSTPSHINPLNPERDPLASRDRVEAMLEQMRRVLHLISFTDHEREQAAMRMLRHIFDRAQLTTRETGALWGIWRQVNWAARPELKARVQGTPEEPRT